MIWSWLRLDFIGGPRRRPLPQQDGISWSAEYQLPELIIILLAVHSVELLGTEKITQIETMYVFWNEKE